MSKQHKDKMISFRVSPAELAHVKNIVKEILASHAYLKEADVLREYFGLRNTGLITPALRAKMLWTEPEEEINKDQTFEDDNDPPWTYNAPAIQDQKPEIAPSTSRPVTKTTQLEDTKPHEYSPRPTHRKPT